VGGIIFSFDQLLLEVGHNRVFSSSRPVVNCSVIRLEYWEFRISKFHLVGKFQVQPWPQHQGGNGRSTWSDYPPDGRISDYTHNWATDDPLPWVIVLSGRIPICVLRYKLRQVPTLCWERTWLIKVKGTFKFK
jgi:hypothetical protein